MSNKLLFLTIAIVIFAIIAAVALFSMQERPDEKGSFMQILRKENPETPALHTQFSQFNPIYRFSAAIPQNWQASYIPEIEAINIYDPSLPGSSSLEKSQIFIGHFVSNRFLSLPNVTINNFEDATISGHVAAEYEIAKKPEAPNFPHAPAWRNSTHRSIDIRLSTASPSPFYTFAYNPNMERAIYDEFIGSLVFHNDASNFQHALLQSEQRVTKLPFGLHISPQDSPVPNDRFTGFHTGSDFEVFEHELSQDVSITASCGGIVRKKQYAKGYGGVLVQECLLEDQPLTIVYGHLNVQSIAPEAGQYLNPGDTIGILGAGHSQETDGERKHLHLSIHKGTAIDIRGYVPTHSELSQWINPQEVLSDN